MFAILCLLLKFYYILASNLSTKALPCLVIVENQVFHSNPYYCKLPTTHDPKILVKFTIINLPIPVELSEALHQLIESLTLQNA